MPTEPTFWTNPRSMEPLLPPISESLAHSCGKLIEAASALRVQLPAETRLALAPLLEQVNCYYSNLIEGQRTYPDEVERAMRRAREDHTTAVLGKKRSNRLLAIEGAAHITTQRRMAERLQNDPTWDPTATESLCDLHRWFIEQLPPEMRKATSRSGNRTVEVIPGELRTTTVEVGDHIPPDHAHLREFMDVFHRTYAPHVSLAPEAIVRIAAAHHRLVWIHPFVDGNGRVARLMTDAMFERAHLGSDGLWPISRGFARKHDVYKSFLAAADEQRHHDTDGRGNLSQNALTSWCEYFIDQAIDQATFMFNLIKPTELRARIMRWSERSDHSPRVGRLICEVMLQGSLDRRTASEVLGKTSRHSLRLINELVAAGLVTTRSHAPLTPKVPLHVAPHWFPDLFPPGVELRLENHPPQ